jgi:hypothetical protein
MVLGANRQELRAQGYNLFTLGTKTLMGPIPNP